MNNFEKLLMIIVPCVGLSLILMFFKHYVDINNPKKNKSTFDISYVQNKPFKNSNKINYPVTEPLPKQVKRTPSKPVNYIRSSDKTYRIHNPIRKKTTTNHYQTQDNFVDAETLYQQDLLRQKRQKQAYQNRIRANKARILRNRKVSKQNPNRCNYIRKMKKHAENAMKRGYRASQYSTLENNRKYWAKKYSNECFN